MNETTEAGHHARRGRHVRRSLIVPASAELHRVTVTPRNGQRRSRSTVDVPPGTSVESIQIPGLPAPVAVDHRPRPGRTPTPTPSADGEPDADRHAHPTRSRAAPTRTPRRPRSRPTGAAQRAAGAPATPARGGRGAEQEQRQRATQPTRSRHDRAVDPNAEALDGTVEQAPETATRRQATSTARNPTQQHRRLADARQPDLLARRRPGPAPIGVPNFFIDKFRIPPFLLPIYQAAGIEYGVRWEVLAAINEIETDYGRNLNVSSAGALGWMQFMPATWEHVRRRRQPATASRTRTTRSTRSSPPRATCAPPAPTRTCARAIFAYNHADWYVDSVLLRARSSAACPPTSSARSPASRRAASPSRPRRPTRATSRAATVKRAKGEQRRLRRRVERAAPRDQDLRPRAARRWSRSTTAASSASGHSRRLGKLRRAAGRLRQHVHVRAPRRSVASRYPTPKPQHGRQARRSRRELAAADARRRARRGPPRRRPRPRRARRASAAKARAARKTPRRRGRGAPAKERLFANPRPPERRGGRRRRSRSDDGASAETSAATSTGVFGLDRSDVEHEAAQGAARGSPPARSSAASGAISRRTAPAPAVRDPAGRPRRPADRPEADPRRLEAARVDRDLPRRGPQPVRRQATRQTRRSARSC